MRCAFRSTWRIWVPPDPSVSIQATYGEHFARLARIRIKAEYDPKNLFRVNQNIEPALA